MLCKLGCDSWSQSLGLTLGFGGCWGGRRVGEGQPASIPRRLKGKLVTIAGLGLHCPSHILLLQGSAQECLGSWQHLYHETAKLCVCCWGLSEGGIYHLTIWVPEKHIVLELAPGCHGAQLWPSACLFIASSKAAGVSLLWLLNY